MKTRRGISLQNVQAVYSGPEGRLWELLMGEQIHIGGMESTLDLARRAGIARGASGLDLCCATGAGMRCLLRFCGMERMAGVDATPHMLELARQRAEAEGVMEKVTFVQADVCATGLRDGCFDFVWGEDAWCYVENKPRLIEEAARVVRSGGVIAFTDWMEGECPLTDSEADRLLGFMKFPSILTLGEYAALLERQGCRVAVSRDTGRFASYVPLYLDILERQHTYDALKLIEFNQELAASLLTEMRFMLELARQGKILQGQIVAERQ